MERRCYEGELVVLCSEGGISDFSVVYIFEGGVMVTLGFVIPMLLCNLELLLHFTRYTSSSRLKVQRYSAIALRHLALQDPSV